MLLRSPQWLFLYPGLGLTACGLIGATLLAAKPISVFGVLTLDVDALLYFAIAAIVGLQITFFGLFAVTLARRMRIRIAQGLPEKLLRVTTLEGVIAAGICLIFAGVCGAIYAVVRWAHSSFGALEPDEILRITIPSVTTLATRLPDAAQCILLNGLANHATAERA
jgi:hypothetical protein